MLHFGRHGGLSLSELKMISAEDGSPGPYLHDAKNPKGSMYPNSRYFGLKVVPIWVLWGQRLYYLGTWSLRERPRKEMTMCRG